MRHAPRPYLLSRIRTGNWFTYQCEAWKIDTWENMTIDEAMTSAITNIIDQKHDGRMWLMLCDNKL